MKPEPVYHLDNDRDRLRLAIAMMHREQRIEFVKRIRARYGEPAAQQLRAGLVEASNDK